MTAVSTDGRVTMVDAASEGAQRLGREDGAAALTTLMASFIGVGLGLVLLLVAIDLGLAWSRARMAADSAALAAVGSSPLAAGNGQPRTAAQELARRNGAQLENLDLSGWPVRVKLAVAVTPARVLNLALPEVSASAAAAVVLPEPAAFAGIRPPPGAGSAPAPGPGGFVRPVAAGVSSPFGYRVHPVTGATKLHAGMDFAAPAGTPIRAAAAGTVASAGWMGGYGYAVVIEHGNGLSTLYAHQSALWVRPGQTVAPGAPIGAVGSTGLSTGPHLHFEVRVGGQPVDPSAYL